MFAQQLFMTAMEVPDYGPVAELAKSVCMIRGAHPYDTTHSQFGSLSKWQAVVFETMLLDILRSNLAASASKG